MTFIPIVIAGPDIFAGGHLHARVAYRHLHPVLRLNRLTLTEFRNYAALTWRPSARISVLYGPNGSGKTNLLEAVSLLVPGRGLRGARTVDLLRRAGIGHGGGETPDLDGGNEEKDP